MDICVRIYICTFIYKYTFRLSTPTSSNPPPTPAEEKRAWFLRFSLSALSFSEAWGDSPPSRFCLRKTAHPMPLPPQRGGGFQTSREYEQPSLENFDLRSHPLELNPVFLPRTPAPPCYIPNYHTLRISLYFRVRLCKCIWLCEAVCVQAFDLTFFEEGANNRSLLDDVPQYPLSIPVSSSIWRTISHRRYLSLFFRPFHSRFTSSR